VDRRIEDGFEMEKRGEAYAFAVRLLGDGRVIGSTSYLAVVAKHRRAEIGSTWYARDCWGTAVNPECKYLLLRHAFEDWGAVRIQLVTDVNNLHSRKAIEKLGAKLEGTMRGHGIRPDGSVRDVRLYSIIPAEWPSVRAGLLSRIRAFGTPERRAGTARGQSSRSGS
jgi:RimJ/RimL family protein N-acetyltransferase